MNLSPELIKNKIAPYVARVGRYLGLIIFLVFFLAISFLIIRINQLTASEPSEGAVSEQLKAVQRPRIDEKAAKKMSELEDQNISVQSLFNEARKNPFTE